MGRSRTRITSDTDGIAQRILLDRAPANLTKLRTDRIPDLRKPLRDLDQAFHHLEEAHLSAGQNKPDLEAKASAL